MLTEYYFGVFLHLMCRWHNCPTASGGHIIKQLQRPELFKTWSCGRCLSTFTERCFGSFRSEYANGSPSVRRGLPAASSLTHTHKLRFAHPDSMTTWRFAQGSKSGRVHLKGSAPERSLSDPQAAQAKCLTREEKPPAITMTLLALTNDCGEKEPRLPCPSDTLFRSKTETA